jgi:drug/metabolite transporter (DMT)-like permease
MTTENQAYETDRTEHLVVSRFDTQFIAVTGVLLSVSLNATGQILFKAARMGHAGIPFYSLFLQPETWAGFLFYGLSSLIWLWVLSRVQLSYAYPILALAFPIVVVFSVILFGESVSLVRWIGISTIVVGVFLLARS